LKTQIIKLDIKNIDSDKLSYIADVLKDGGLVAFPTETVYGLGANALNENAVKNIFKAKGRPSDNPLIVHISDYKILDTITSNIPENALQLMAKYWPGPLTLVMEKSSKIPFIITAGLSSVAVRFPSHPIARALIAASGLPIAAPSANLSGKSSPTTAEHVIADLNGKVDVIVDAGNCNVGLESTVLDVTVNPPMLLRPGGITPNQIEAVVGKIVLDPALMNNKTIKSIPKSPGMKYTHYSPKADLIIVEGNLNNVVKKINELQNKYENDGLNVGILATEQTKAFYNSSEIISMGDRLNPDSIASNLFWSFREFDNRNIQIIIAEAIDNSGIGLAIMNRMTKAAGNNVIHV
jgi:L-threonylcarbamoyladenylate synthase